MPTLYIQFETDADVDAALNAIGEAEQDGYIEGIVNIHRPMPEEHDDEQEIHWD